MDDHELYLKVEQGIDAFSSPFNDLDKLLRMIPDEALRKMTLRDLAQAFCHLDKVGYEYRRHLGITKLE